MSYEPDVPDIAALKNLVPTTLDHPRVRVLTPLQEFWLDLDSTADPDDITVVRGSPLIRLSRRVPTDSTVADRSVGCWIRNPLPVPEWTAKRTWFQDNVAGNDEYSGDQSAPVRTIAEIARRLRRVDSGLYTIQVLREVVSTDSVCFAAELGDIKSPVLASTQTVGSILIRGTRTKEYSGMFTATTKTDPATNAQATVTDLKNADPLFKWSDQDGKLIEATWEVGSKTVTVQAVILKVLPADSARVSEWVDPLTGNPIPVSPPVAPPPAPATYYVPDAKATYRILALTPFAAQIGYSSLPLRVQLSFQDLTIWSPPVTQAPPGVPGILLDRLHHIVRELPVQGSHCCAARKLLRRLLYSCVLDSFY